MRLLLTFIKAYPGRSALMLLALLLAGVAEGASLAALLPLLSIVMGKDVSGSDGPVGDSQLGSFVHETFGTVGIALSLELLLVLIVIAMIIRSLLLVLARKQIGYTAARVATDLRLALLRGVLAAQWQYFSGKPSGQVANSIAGEANRSAEAYVNGATMISQSVIVMIYVVLALVVSWQATLVAFVAGVGVLLISHSLVRMSRRAGEKQTLLSKSLLTRLADTLASVKPLKAMAREYLAGSVLSTETKQVNRAIQKQVLSKAGLSAAQDSLYVILVAAGIYVAHKNFGMSLETILVLVLVLGRMMMQMGKIQTWYQKMVVAESAFWSIRESIEDAERHREIPSGSRAPVLQEAIRFDAVSLSYGDNRVLAGASLEVPAGSLTAIVGPSGVGKTTVIDLVTGLLRPSSGKILVDDQSLIEIDIRAWRRMIGYVPQENLLLHDSVLNNVTLGDPGLTIADAEEALRKSGAWGFVEQMPEGIHSTVGERGTKLSGGQRQRIMIARALVQRPSLLILDEATSALDPENEAAICETLAELRGSITVLAISHQPAIVNVADRVYRLSDGRAVPANQEPGRAAGSMPSSA
ncbi:MAG: ATP-binding cassette domain-containing protein [Chromatiales bacterium]|jgi:ATP-binding cassette subfamily C protein